MFGRISIKEVIIVLLIALVIFGYRKLPEIGKALGQAINSFRKNVSADDASDKDNADKQEEQS